MRWDCVVRPARTGHVDRPIRIQPCDTVTYERTGAAAAESRKTSSNQYFPICLYRQTGDFRVGAGIEAGVQCAVWVYACNMIAHACAAATAAESGEKSADYDFPVRLNRQRIDNVVRTAIEAEVGRAAGIASPDLL